MTEKEIIQTVISCFSRVVKENGFYELCLEILQPDVFPHRLLKKNKLYFNHAVNPFWYKKSLHNLEDILVYLCQKTERYTGTEESIKRYVFIATSYLTYYFLMHPPFNLDGRLLNILRKDVRLISNKKLLDDDKKPMTISTAHEKLDKMMRQQHESVGIALGNINT